MNQHTANVFLPGCLGPVRREVVLADEAQSELAALREELAEWKARSGRRTAERTQFMNERDEYKQANALLIESCAEKFDLLTAAEQRNAEHIKVLLTFASCADVRRVGTGAMDYVAKLGAFKPTESGASEPGYIGLDVCVSCSGRFGEFKTCSNSLLSKAYYVECASCGAKTSGYDKAASAVKEWNSRSKRESGASE